MAGFRTFFGLGPQLSQLLNPQIESIVVPASTNALYVNFNMDMSAELLDLDPADFTMLKNGVPFSPFTMTNLSWPTLRQARYSFLPPLSCVSTDVFSFQVDEIIVEWENAEHGRYVQPSGPFTYIIP